MRRGFDLSAHRGWLASRPESTLSAFAAAVRLGVSSLELDVQITRDGHAVVTHDRRVDGRKCQDTAPATPGDTDFPYVGRYVNTLTLAQLRTLDCGVRTLPEFPGQRPVPGARMPLLREVFDLVTLYRADDVRINVEVKVEAGAPHETAPREQFVRIVAAEVRAAGMLDRVSVLSFDWGALMLMRRVEPRLPIVALTNWEFLRVGWPGRSPWLGGLDLDDFTGDPISAIGSFGADAFSPLHGSPQDGAVDAPGYQPHVTRDLVDRAHRHGIAVVPWTVDDAATMDKLIDDGVDGIVTNRPDVLRRVLAGRGAPLPRGYANLVGPVVADLVIVERDDPRTPRARDAMLGRRARIDGSLGPPITQQQEQGRQCRRHHRHEHKPMGPRQQAEHPLQRPQHLVRQDACGECFSPGRCRDE
jgi:glycerophosphoryl diester phosphodiesterase